MKRLYDFITKANQVIFFLTAMALVGFAAYKIIAECFRDEWAGPQVPIARTPEERGKIKIDDIHLLGKRAGHYVFGVIKGMIDARDEFAGDISSAASKITGSGAGSAEIVNVLFVSAGVPPRSLLKSDGLVLTYTLASQRPNEGFRFHRFYCITEDTNGDHVLDRNDRRDLYVVDMDLKRADMIIEDAGSVEEVSPTVLLSKNTDSNGVVRFFEIDCEARTQTEVVWK